MGMGNILNIEVVRIQRILVSTLLTKLNSSRWLENIATHCSTFVSFQGWKGTIGIGDPFPALLQKIHVRDGMSHWSHGSRKDFKYTVEVTAISDRTYRGIELSSVIGE